MKDLVVLGAGGFGALVIWGFYYTLVKWPRREREQQRRKASWQFRHSSRNGQTLVTVSLVAPGSNEVLEEHKVDCFPDNDPDWENRLLTAKQVAEERAFHLNGGGTITS